MDIESILNMIQGLPVINWILPILGIVVVAAQAIVIITPSPKDNALMAKLEAIPVLGHLIRALKSFAPWQKK